MNSLYEVCFSIEGGESNTQWVTTLIQAAHPEQAKSLVEAQYGSNCRIHSCYQKN
jgi:hypothetical protein